MSSEILFSAYKKHLIEIDKNTTLQSYRLKKNLDIRSFYVLTVNLVNGEQNTETN